MIRPAHDPSFLIIGAQKCGTTSLHYYLQQQPELTGSRPKEVHFFDRDGHLGKTVTDYRRAFKGFRNRIFFEATPEYLYTPGAAELIHSIYPDIPLVVCLRDPVKRAYSAWNHYRHLFETGGFIPAIQNQPRRAGNHLYTSLFEGRSQFPTFRECLDIELEMIEHRNGYEPALLRRGLYLEQLTKYWSLFPTENLLILGFRDLVERPEEIVSRVCEFVGTRKGFSRFDDEPRNTKSYRERMSDADRQLLEQFYEKPNALLFERLGEVSW